MTAAKAERFDGVRIAVLNWRDPWQDTAGGAEVFAYEISRGLAAAGADVHFLTSRDPGQTGREARDGVVWLRRGGRWTVYPAVLARLLLARWTRRPYDVVLDCQNGIPFFAPLAVSTGRTPVLIVVHHVHDEQFGTHFPQLVAAFGRWLEGPASRWVYRRYTAVAVSASTIAAMRTRLRWRGPIALVPNGVRQPLHTDGPGPAPLRTPQPRVVAVGRLVRHKRLEQVVRLADQLADIWPGLDIHLVGRGPDEPRIRAAVSRLADPTRVTVHGYLPESEKNALLRTAWLHISASQGEGWGLSVLEAAALGIPTVAYDVDGLRDAIRDGETGWLVADGESLRDAIFRALREIDGNPARAAQISEAAVAWAGLFDWDRSVELTTALIRAELDRGAGRRRSWQSRTPEARAPERPSAATRGDSEERLRAPARRR